MKAMSKRKKALLILVPFLICTLPPYVGLWMVSGWPSRVIFTVAILCSALLIYKSNLALAVADKKDGS